MKRKVMFLFVVALLLVTMTAPALAADPIKVLVDGKSLDTDVPAQNINGRVLVPLRAIFEALGAEVYWDSSTRTAVGSKVEVGTTVVKLTIDSKNFIKETFNPYVRNDLPLDVSAMIIDGRTMVPARVIGESMGAKVEWDGTTNTVIIRRFAEHDDTPFYMRETNWVVKEGVIKESNGVYEGWIRENDFGSIRRKFGQGVFYYNVGDIYDGLWRDNIRQGWGTIFYANGTKYEGQWFRDQRHGLGTFYYNDGSIYKGQWNYEKRHGLGTLTYANGDRYVGQFRDGDRHGYGEYTWASGQVFRGQFENDKRVD